MYLEQITPDVEKIISRCFPSYTGKKVEILTSIPSQLRSYWDGGSKTSYVFYGLSDGKTYQVESNHPFFEAGKPCQLNGLPLGVILVSHVIFCGKDIGIRIYANNQDIAPMLPNKTEITENEKIVLAFTSGLKSSYAGISNYRFNEAHKTKGITLESWETSKTELINKGMLTKQGAITPKGRNAIAGIPQSFTWSK